MGLSLFLAAVLLLIYQRIGVKRRDISYIGISFLLLTFLITSKNEIDNYFINELTGWKASDQQEMQDKILNVVQIRNEGSTLYLFDTSDDAKNYRFYEVSSLPTLPQWMNYRMGSKDINVCRTAFYGDRKRLSEFIVQTKDGYIIKYPGYCIENGVQTYKEILFKPNNLFSYKLKDMEVLDITDEVLNEFKLK